MAWTKEQESAINETGTNIIVSAGAGSGKTAVLTARTMRILLSGTHINELLILTFTKAAAAEMKERIRKKIKESIPEHPHLSAELERIDQSYVTTFDSFALSVVKKYHYLLNLPNNIGISDSSIIEIQKIKILDEVFDKYYEAHNPLFSQLIYDFCVKDDKELKNYILKIATKIDGKPDRDAYLKNYLADYFNPEYIDKCLKEYNKILINQIAEISDLSYELSMYTDGDFNEKLDASLCSLKNAKTIDEIYQNAINIKLPSLKRGSDDATKQAKDDLKKSLDNLKDTVTTYGLTDEIIASIQSTKPYTEVIISIITDYLDRFHEYKAQNEIYDFQDIALLSIRILKENKSVCDEMKNTFKEIMIDEYQDTNDIQETFISLIENNNVYMVGDIKQSIYRFRNANPYIFKSKYDRYAKHDNGLKIDLVKNFRSRGEVLSNINLIFNLIMDDEIGGADYQTSHQMVFGNTTYINEGKTDYNYDFEVLEYPLPEDNSFSKEEIEIFTIAKDIKEKVNSKYQVFDKDAKVLKNIIYSDFVILMDRTSSFDLYKKIFEYMGIPLTLYKDETLNNSNDIYIIKNIIDYIIKINKKEFDKEYKYDFVSIARSYLYQFTDQDIFNCFKNNNFKDNIIYETFSPLANEISNNSVTNLLYQIIEKTNMYQKFIEVGDINASITRLSNLLDIAANLSSLGYDIYTFRDYLTELLNQNYPIKYKTNGTDNNAVRIMTIHASKGLEYHICYYSGLYKKFNIQDLNEKFLIDNKYGIITPYFDCGINESLIKYLVKYNYIEEEVSEKIRLFYVALTRAKEKMILLNPLPKAEPLNRVSLVPLHIRRNYRSFSDILNSIKPNIKDYYQTVKLEDLSLTKDYLYKKIIQKLENSDNEIIAVNELSTPVTQTVTQAHFHKNLTELIDKDKQKNIELGLKVHEYLEYLDFTNPHLELIDDQFIREKIQKFLSSPLLVDIANATIFKEYEFIYQDENKEYHGIIDLMLEYPNRIDIVDYKLNNIKDENYLNQLNGYKKYIHTVSQKEIHIYLYSIISETLEEL